MDETWNRTVFGLPLRTAASLRVATELFTVPPDGERLSGILDSTLSRG
jgi:hypothetical protein